MAFGPRISELGEQGYGPKTKTFQPSHENYFGVNYLLMISPKVG